MIEIVDTAPEVNVQPAEYRRLLGYPPDHDCSERALELSRWARDWYAHHGRPWTYAREVGDVVMNGDGIQLERVSFHSKPLQEKLEKAGAHGVFLVAAGAGDALEQEAQRLWEEGKPDEYFFLEVYGSAVVEHLNQMAGARLCAWAEEQGMAVLPHYSPGYPQWDIGEQGRLLELIGMSGERGLPDRLEALPSGALRPKKSQLSVFGFTRHTEQVRRLTELIPCESCLYVGCQYRRVPNRDVAAIGPVHGRAETFHFIAGNGTAPVRPRHQVRYTIKMKALRRWAQERLSLQRREDGTIEAIFRYEGTTCTNMGRPMTYHYFVALDPRDNYRIREQSCAPAPGDTGHTYMCRFLENPQQLSEAIANEKPLLGQPLSAALEWQRTECAPGCYCEPESRRHKWGIVLETIHYALSHQEKQL